MDGTELCIPVMRGPGKSKELVAYWCIFCVRLHVHGSPVGETDVGWRATHCPCAEAFGYNGTVGSLQVVGYAQTSEWEHAHRAGRGRKSCPDRFFDLAMGWQVRWAAFHQLYDERTYIVNGLDDVPIAVHREHKDLVRRVGRILSGDVRRGPSGLGWAFFHVRNVMEIGFEWMSWEREFKEVYGEQAVEAFRIVVDETAGRDEWERAMRKTVYGRRPLTKKERYLVLERSGYACAYCGAKAPDVELHVDHILPVAHGGDNDPENLVAACSECNLGKSAHLPNGMLREALEVVG